MGHLIQCCVSNDNGEFLKRVDEIGTDARLREDVCLQRCGVCYDSPFAIVDGDLVESNSPTALVSAVRTRVDE